jgi:cobalt-zinc-cadmium efflux system membrane fusion protein
LVDPKDIHLNLKVFEKDLIQLSVGQKLYAYSNSQSDKKFKCEIILISQDITSDRTAEVHCHFEKYDKTLLPGMYMNAEIDLKNKVSLAVEEKAVVNFEGASYLFIKTGKSTFEMREVKLGNVENGWVEVINKEQFMNQKIVTDGAYTLLMSLKNESEE